MTPAWFQNETRSRAAAAIFLLALLVLGAWLRMRNLGELSLIVDEGVQALAVQGILKYGVPKMDSGIIYSRDLSFLYTQAAVVKLFELNPFWLRFPSAVFGACTILPIYLLGKTLFNRKVGLLASAILAFSVWEIEMSRYARPYTAFQLMYLFSLLYFYRGFMLDERKYKFWFLVAALITISTHHLSRALGTCFLIPLLFTSFARFRKLSIALWGFVFVAMLILYHKFIGHFIALGDMLPPAEEGQISMPAVFKTVQSLIGLPLPYIPDLSLFVQMAQQNTLQFAGLSWIAISATAYLIYRAVTRDNAWRVIYAIVMVWAVFAYQFALVAVMLPVYIVLFVRDIRKLWEPTLKVVYATTAIYLIIWLFIISTHQILTIGQVLQTMFGFPHLTRYFLYWFVKGWPIMAAVLALGCILLLRRLITDRNDQAPLFVLGSIFIPVILTSFFWSYAESRYAFHLYPLIIIVFSMMSIKAGVEILKHFSLQRKWVRRLAAVAMLPAIFFISQDANPLYAWEVSNRTYQSAKDPIRSVINRKPDATFHQDHKTPSFYVKARLLPTDRVVVLGPSYTLAIYHFYIGKIDYILEPARGTFSYGKLREGKIIDYATGSEILRELSAVKNLIEKSSGGIWILGDRRLLAEDNDYYSKPMKEYIGSLTHGPDSVGLDGRTFAVKVR